MIFNMQQAIYRIIDANFNRAREAARVMEEFARFVLSSKPLSSRAKGIRHRLCSVMASLEQAALLMSRESGEDVGKALAVDSQLKRKDLQDVFTAAAKRLPEALRALAETIQTINPAAAAEIEQLRFEAYCLEKDIFAKLNTRDLFERVRLYVLLDGSLGDKLESLAKECIAGGADCLQLRCKEMDNKLKYEMAIRLVRVCRDNGAVSIINDSTDIAIASGADGVHLGQDDLPVQTAKKLLPRPMLIGLSTHNTAQLREAIQSGADYVGLGPAFTTSTKPGIEVAGIEYIKEAITMLKDTGIGYAAIGGITMSNIDALTQAGVRTAAVCSAVSGADNPRQMCRELKDKLMQTKKKK